MAQRQLSKADLITLIVLAILFGAAVPTVFAQALQRARELANRATCAANVRGIVNSLVIYSADQSDQFPSYKPTTDTKYETTMKPDEGETTADATISGLYKDNKYSENPSATLWLLVLKGQAAPKVFICPSDPFNVKAAAATTEPSVGPNGELILPTQPPPTYTAASLTSPTQKYYRNFQDSKNISYSTAYPWAESNKGTPLAAPIWKNTVDASLPIVSDMAPFLGSKSEPASRPAGSDSKAALDAAWATKKANSQNHQFDGQNVAYADTHVDFERTPAIGQANDSIWGIWKTNPGDEVPLEPGILPHPLGGSPGMFDIVMVPTRDAKGDLK